MHSIRAINRAMTVTNDQLDTVRISLGALLVLTNIGVWWGVALESDKNSETDKERGWKLLVRSLAAEAALAFALLAIDTVIGIRQKAEIAVAQKLAGDAMTRASLAEKATAEALERAAKAEKGAAEAKLALAKINAPRVIPPQQIFKMMGSLRAYTGRTFWIITEKNEPDVDGEQENLAAQFSKLFAGSGWLKDAHWSRLDATKIDPGITPVSNRGCSIDTSDDPKSSEIAKLLIDMLKEADIECRAFQSPEMKPDHLVAEIGLR
jgi:hypothetical protein